MSRLNNGCPLYDSASKTLWYKLDVIQHYVLRIYLGVPITTYVENIEVELGYPSLQLRQLYLITNYFFKFRWNFTLATQIMFLYSLVN